MSDSVLIPGRPRRSPRFSFGTGGTFVMADAQGGAFSQRGGGTPQEVSDTPELEQQGGGEQQAGQGQKYITVEDALQLFDQLFDRKAQSITDKTANRVQKILSAAQEQGVSLTKAQAKTLVEEFDNITRAEQNPGQSSRQQPAQAQQPGANGQPDELHPVLLTAQAMMEEAGISIEDNDPELALIDQQTTSAKRFLDSVEQAIEAKRERLSQQRPARMPNLSSGGKGAGGGKAADTAELTRLLEAPGAKDWVKIRELKARLATYK